ncbi:DUF2441 domain-containing protein [Bradyrhizobium sp. McL0616]|uniref:DUF2441 domain-containing protein n=1 Tax=Bradyrhizobium sp. McL0616 TaxID=3415674 RepID=UPI003CEBE6A4
MNIEPYYYLASLSLEPGSIIRPGNWGRIIERYETPSAVRQTFGNLNTVARELLFEMVRLETFPDRPSRLRAAFCCPALADMQFYRAKIDPHGFQIIYEVELLEPDQPTHIAPLAMVDFAEGSLFLSETSARAQRYWTGHPDGPQEIVTLSPLKIRSVMP